MRTRYFLGRKVEIDYVDDSRSPWFFAPDEGSSGEWFWDFQLFASPWGEYDRPAT